MATKKPKQAYLKSKDYFQAYTDAQRLQRLFHLPFREYERLAANKVRQDLPSNIPRVNDGTLAGLLRETPMRVLAQIPTGKVCVLETTDKDGKPVTPPSWVNELMSIIWNKQILPFADTQATPLNKMQLALYKALIYGSQPVYTFFTVRNGKRIADFMLPEIRDVYLEVGKQSDLDSDYIFMDTWYTPLQLDKIIAAANNVLVQGKDSSWKIDVLKQIRANGQKQKKDWRNKNQAERNRPVMADYYKFTTVFQRGVGAPFDTFYSGNGETGPAMIVRHKVNEDPTGALPIHFLYAYEDLVNPYGVGQVEVSGGTQNVLDYMTQLHVLANQIGLQPPILIQGDRSMTDMDSMVYSGSQFWLAGNAKIDIMETSSDVIKEFPQAYNIYKSQLTSMQSTTPVDIAATDGNTATGKTPAAISQNQLRESSHDNYLRKQSADTFRRVFNSMLNIYVANMTGDDVVRLLTDDALRLTREGIIPVDAKGNPQFQEIEMQWDEINGNITVDIDARAFKDSTDQQTIDALNTVLTVVQQNPYMLQYIQSTGFTLNLGNLYAELLTAIGVPDIDKILTPLSSADKAQAQSVPPMVFDKPKIDMKYPDLPPAAQLQLLNKVGISLTMEDILAGPVLDPNIRGVFTPQPQPGEPQNPIQRQPAVDPSTGQPTPPSPISQQLLMPSKSFFAPNPNLDPAVAQQLDALEQQAVQQGMPPEQAAAVKEEAKKRVTTNG